MWLNSPQTSRTDHTEQQKTGFGFHGPTVDRGPAAVQHRLTFGNKPE